MKYPVNHLAVVCLAALLCACGSFDNSIQRGYIAPEGAVEQVPVGSSREQVLFVLGTPSTTSTLDSEAFYYISQEVEQTPFLGPQIRNQKVLAIYFDKTQRVNRIANYGLQDGKLFDFASRTTPTGGRDVTFLQQLFSNVSRN